jgi:hypothetical protein
MKWLGVSLDFSGVNRSSQQKNVFLLLVMLQHYALNIRYYRVVLTLSTVQVKVAVLLELAIRKREKCLPLIVYRVT